MALGGTGSGRGDRDRAYLQRLEAAASERGVLDQAKKAAVAVPQGMWNMLVGFTLREEAAMAGLAEAIRGNGREGESPGGRFIREALGGTKLGNMFSLDKPDRKLWNQFLKESGVPGGLALSDVIGENLVTRRFDPNARESAALGLAIFTAPTSYFSMGAGITGKFVGKSGKIIASPKAYRLARRIYNSDLERIGLRHGIKLTGEVDSRIWKSLENDILTVQRDAVGWKGLGHKGIGEVSLKLRRTAQARVVELSTRGKVPGLDLGRGVRIGDMRWMGVPIKGVKVLDFERVGAAGTAIGESLRRGRATGAMMRGADSVVGTLDRVFNRIPSSLRRSPLFVKIEERRHSLVNAAPEIVARKLRQIRGGLSSKVWNNPEFRGAFALAADNPKKYMEALRARFGEVAVDSVGRWHAIANDMGSSAWKLDMLEEAQFLKYKDGYFPHKLNLANEGIDDFYAGSGRASEFAGGDIRPHERQRVADNFDELFQMINDAGLDPEKLVDFDLNSVMGNYMQKHVEGVAGINFANDIVEELVPSFGSVMRKLAGELDETPNIPRSELVAVRDALRVVRDSGLLPKNMATALEGVSETARVSFLREAFMDVKSFGQLTEMFGTLKRVIDKTNIKELNALRNRSLFSRRVERDLDLAEHTFTTGRLRGQKYLIPKPMKQFFTDNEIQLARGLNKESTGILKAFDLLTNTFKSSHTVLFAPFHARNGLSNISAMLASVSLDQALNPRRAWRAWQIAHDAGEWSVKAADGTVYTRRELTNLFHSLDITPDRMMQAELVGGQRSFLGKIPGLKQAEEVGGRIGGGIENSARAQYALTLIENGVDPAEAARLMKQVLFDYNDLSRIERDFFKRIFPFYTWTRKNAEVQLRNLATRPGGTLSQVRAIQSQDKGPRADLLPEYLRGELKVELKTGPGKGLFITGLDLPISNIDVLWAGGVGRTMREQWGMFTPVLKAPLEWMLNIDTFTNQSINGRKWLGQMGPEIKLAWPKVMRDWVDLKEIETSDGRKLYTANGTKVWLLTKNILVGRLLNEGTRLGAVLAEFGNGNQKEGARGLFRVLSGMRFTEFDLDEAQKARLKDRIRNLEDWMIEKGMAAEFKRVYTVDEAQ